MKRKGVAARLGLKGLLSGREQARIRYWISAHLQENDAYVLVFHSRLASWPLSNAWIISPEESFAKLCKSEILSYSSLMAIDPILAQIDAEIARLKEARSVLANLGTVTVAVAELKTSKAPVKAKRRKKRVLSPEARKRIADAQRKRWAAQKAKTKSK